MKAYKVFNPNWTCRDFKFEVGKTYETEKEPKICSSGFHGCKKVADCFSYYDFDSKNKVAEVELFGTVFGKDNDKSCSNKIRIIREVSWGEMLTLANTGHWNTGHRNTGDWNTGHWNTGDRNTGDWNTGHRNTGDSNTGDRNTGYSNTACRNTGDWNTGHSNTGDSNTGHSNTGDSNTGDWNTGDWNTGNFCVKTPQKLWFDKEYKGKDPIIPNCLYFNLTVWIYDDDMTEKEKSENENYKTLGGYLKKLDYKEAFKASMKNATKDEIKQVKALPNFNASKFYKISGFRIK